MQINSAHFVMLWWCNLSHNCWVDSLYQPRYKTTFVKGEMSLGHLEHSQSSSLGLLVFLSLSLSLSHARSWHFLVVQLTVRDHLYVRKEVKFCRVCQGQGPQGMYCKNGPRSAIFLLCSSFRNPEVHEVQKFYILLRSNEVIPVQCSDGTSPQFRRGSCPSEDSHRC